MDIQTAVSTLKGVARDLRNGLLRCYADVDAETYALEMIDHPLQEIAELLALDDESTVRDIIYRTADRLEYDLEGGVLVSDSDEITTAEYVDTVVLPVTEAFDETNAPTP